MSEDRVLQPRRERTCEHTDLDLYPNFNGLAGTVIVCGACGKDVFLSYDEMNQLLASREAPEAFFNEQYGPTAAGVRKFHVRTER